MSEYGSRLNGSKRLPNAGRVRSTVVTLSQIPRQRRYVSAAVAGTTHLSPAALGVVAANFVAEVLLRWFRQFWPYRISCQ